MPFFSPALLAAGVSGVVSVAGLIVTTGALRRLRAEKLESDRALAERLFKLVQALAERHAAIDRALAELKSKNDHDQSELNRMIGLADQAIVQFHQIKRTVDRSPNSFGGEASRDRPRRENEEDHEALVFDRVDRIIDEIKKICHPPMHGSTGDNRRDLGVGAVAKQAQRIEPGFLPD
jgi:hypothetical protein